MKTSEDKEQIKISCFVTGALFCFVFLFCTPLDIYLSNIGDILMSSKYIIIPFAVISLIVLTLLYLILVNLKEKVRNTFISLLTGLSLAFYVQGNFLQTKSLLLDGTKLSFPIIDIIINTLIWAVMICIPFLIYRFIVKNSDKAIRFIAVMIFVMGSTSLFTQCYNIVSYDDTAILTDCLTNTVDPFILSLEERYDFSADHNFIVILTDEYDSFAFDDTLKNYPDSSAELHDFTYYRDTLGMYGYSAPSFDYMFGNKMIDEGSYNTEFYDTLKNNGYKIQMYTSKYCFPINIFEDYTDNYSAYKIRPDDIARLDSLIVRLSMFKGSPLIFKTVFYTTSAEITKAVSAGSSYYPDNLSFYNSIPDEYTLNSTKLYKFIYIYGLHDPRDINMDLKRVNEEISPEEAGVAVNKILTKFIINLKKSGTYDNSDIIILADHGIKSNSDGRYPMLLIKRAGEHHDELNISDVNVSHADIFPTFLYLAGSDRNLRTIFDLTDEDNPERYFAGRDEYIIGDIDKDN